MLHLAGITKSFGAARAVDGVSLAIDRGEIVGLVGQNGAGKTTLMRILAGEIAPDSGSISLDGRPVAFRSPRDADAHGIEMVHQELLLVDDFSIAENIALTWRDRFAFASRRATERLAAEAIARTGIAIPDVARRAGDLSVGERARLELAKALAKRPRVLILDEPTAVLTPHESAELFEVMRRIAAEGTAVVFISHKLPEVLQVSGRIVVMRDGRITAETRAAESDPSALALAMIGKLSEGPAASPALRPDAAEGGGAPLRTILCCDRVEGVRLRDFSLEVRAGEIVAIVGVAGNGQRELAAILRGLTRPRSGSVVIDADRVAHIPEDRAREGIVAEMSIAENLALGGPWNRREAHAHAERMIETYSIRARGASQRTGALSGGNQQKVVLARELGRDPALIVASEPARGLDIEATRFVHERLLDAAAQGAAILLVTSDLDEAFALAGAIHVIDRGRLSERMTPAEAVDRVPHLMAGFTRGADDSPAPSS